jgi:hypothetical protein
MDGLGLAPGRFGKPLGRPAREGGERDAPALLLEDPEDALDQGRLAGSGAARDDEQLARHGFADGQLLLVGEFDPVLVF